MIRPLLATFALCFLIVSPAVSEDDLIFRNITIHDGTGNSPLVGHVAIKNEKITSVGTGDGPDATWVIDGTGLVICPGFIDLHSHSDSGVVSAARRACVNYLMQGCTTSVTGNCGFGPVDVEDYYTKIDAAGAGTNVAHLLPQGSLRMEVLGDTSREATEKEMDEMRALARKAMDDGAWGMATGLIYNPGTFTSTEELIEIAKVIAEGDGIYASHIRNESSELLASVLEAIRIGEEAGCPTHVSHFKVTNTSNWGTIRLAIDAIEKAQQRGLTVTADQYPYIAASTSLEPSVFPSWSRAGGTKELITRLEDPEVGPRVRADVGQAITNADEGRQIVIASCRKFPDYVGKNLYELGQAEQCSAVDISEKIIRNGGAAVVKFAMSEDDVRLVMTYEWVATGSDSSSRLPSANRPHPRGFGTFPRKIGYYAIRENVISVDQAIRSATGLAADILGMTDRGYLKPGLVADIVVFDPETFVDRATYEDPHQYPSGIKHVLVNGTMAVYDGTPTGALAGKALKKNAESRPAK